MKFRGYCTALFLYLLAGSVSAQMDRHTFAQNSLWLTRGLWLEYKVEEQKSQILGWRGERLAPLFADKPTEVRDAFATAQRKRLRYQGLQLTAIGLSVAENALRLANRDQNSATINALRGVSTLGSAVFGFATTLADIKQFNALQKATWVYNRSLLGADNALLTKYDERSLLLGRQWWWGIRYTQNGQTTRARWGFGGLRPALSQDETTQTHWRKARTKAVVGLAALAGGCAVGMLGVVNGARAYDSEGVLVNEPRLRLSERQLMIGQGVLLVGTVVRWSAFRSLYRTVYHHNARVPFD